MPTPKIAVYFIGKPREPELRLLVRAKPFNYKQEAAIQTGVSVRFVAGWAQFLEEQQKKAELLAALNALREYAGLEGVSAEFDPAIETDLVLLRFDPAVDMNLLIEAVIAVVHNVIEMEVEVDPHYLGVRPNA